jgi:hypothetical protein
MLYALFFIMVFGRNVTGETPVERPIKESPPKNFTLFKEGCC